VPKGHIDPGEHAHQSAEREALEEAGLRGRACRNAVGSYRYEKAAGPGEVQVFLLEVTDVLRRWPERKRRARVWVGAKEARRRVRDPGLRALLKRARQKPT
jgi:8-oxo-dGTP pyrophosphatase MutT (NUDIX family)